MIITRKIQVFVYDTDVAQKKEYIHTLYSWRDLVRRGANMIVAHKFAQQNIRDFVYLKDEIKDKFYVKDILKEGKGMSEQNTTYRLLSEMMKGKVPSDIFSCLNQSVAHTFKETEKDMIIGKASVEVIRTISLCHSAQNRFQISIGMKRTNVFTSLCSVFHLVLH
jgi:hypothetical protein